MAAPCINVERAISLKSLRSLGRPFFGTGMMQNVFQRVGTFPNHRLRLKMWCRDLASSAAQAFNSLGHSLSGPAAFLEQSLLSSRLTWSAVMEIEMEMEGMEESEDGRGGGWIRELVQRGGWGRRQV